jgi:hypothetical protein
MSQSESSCAASPSSVPSSGARIGTRRSAGGPEVRTAMTIVIDASAVIHADCRRTACGVRAKSKAVWPNVGGYAPDVQHCWTSDADDARSCTPQAMRSSPCGQWRLRPAVQGR